MFAFLLARRLTFRSARLACVPERTSALASIAVLRQCAGTAAWVPGRLRRVAGWRGAPAVVSCTSLPSLPAIPVPAARSSAERQKGQRAERHHAALRRSVASCCRLSGPAAARRAILNPLPVLAGSRQVVVNTVGLLIPVLVAAAPIYMREVFTEAASSSGLPQKQTERRERRASRRAAKKKHMAEPRRATPHQGPR